LSNSINSQTRLASACDPLQSRHFDLAGWRQSQDFVEKKQITNNLKRAFTDTTDQYCPSVTRVLANIFLQNVTNGSEMLLREQYLATHMPANINLPGGQVLIAEALLDSGATNANYMSGDYYNKNEPLLRQYTKATSNCVYF
jgi:hypothetical protein